MMTNNQNGGVTNLDSNEAVWCSGEVVRQWASEAPQREKKTARQWQWLADLLPYEVDEAFTFADLGAGTGPAARTILERYPRSTALLAEFSHEMMAEGELAMADWRERYRYVEFDMRHGPWPVGLGKQLDAVVSSLCIHHLPDERKAQLFKEIYDHLVPGGWFINYDCISAPDPIAQAAWLRVTDRRDPEGSVRRANRTPEERVRYENHIRHMSPLDRQFGYLRQVGFEGIDAFWKSTEFVVYGGRRPT
jgi:tRNA (cmo5U34)-methyltransferase